MGVGRIGRLRDCGIFHDFTWPADLPNFGRYNLIYGWNWSGKTTISRLFRALEMRTAPTSGQVTLSVNGHDVSGEDFAQAVLPVRVFNRDFVTESIFPVRGGDVPPIFVVGRESVEKQKQVERLKGDLAKAEGVLESARSQKETIERDLDKFCIDLAKVIKDTLRSPGENPYNNYDKSNCRRCAEQMVREGNRDLLLLLSEPDREKLLVQHMATPKPKLQLVTYQFPALRPLADSVSQLVAETVVSAAIQSLKDDPELAQWIHEGLGLHRDRRVEKCLFCEQTLPKERLDALQAHFSAEYERFLNRLNAQISKLQDLSGDAASLALPNRAELYEDLASDYNAAEKSVHAAVNEARAFLESLVQALTEKRNRTFESSSLEVPATSVDLNAVDRLNEVIRKHNQACDDFQRRVAEARRRVEAASVAQELPDFVKLTEAAKASAAQLTRAEAELRRLTGEIADLEREIVGHRRSAEELNEDLRKYLGHDELRLEMKDTGYGITRNGVPADSLSEGEMTAIALLYFLKSLQDHRFDLQNGVVVLDDPVSSLDANALYLAFGLIRERTQNAAQVFIFTHNFAFFRQVRNWFHNLKGQKKKDTNKRPARFYMLECAYNQGQRCASIRALDRLLETYESEYHYLFDRIYREAKALTEVALEENLVLPNVARRLLESFLAFREPGPSGELWDKVNAIHFDEARKLRVLRFVHTYSHSDVIGEPEHDPSLLGEVRSVLADLLDLMKSQDPQHFAAMEKLVAPRNDDWEDE